MSVSTQKPQTQITSTFLMMNYNGKYFADTDEGKADSETFILFSPNHSIQLLGNISLRQTKVQGILLCNASCKRQNTT